MSATWPYNSIYHILWRSKRFRALDGEDKLLLLWYMTNENRPAIGVYRAPDQYPAAELKWDIEQVIQSRLRLMEVNGMRARDHVEGAVSIAAAAGYITFTNTDLNNNTNLGGVVVSKPATVPGLIFKDCLGYTPLVATQSWTPGAILNQGQAFVAVTVAGAEVGNFVEVSSTIDLLGTTLKGYVSNTNTVIVVCNNFTGSTQTLGAMTLRVKVERHTF